VQTSPGINYADSYYGKHNAIVRLISRHHGSTKDHDNSEVSNRMKTETSTRKQLSEWNRSTLIAPRYK